MVAPRPPAPSPTQSAHRFSSLPFRRPLPRLPPTVPSRPPIARWAHSLEVRLRPPSIPINYRKPNIRPYAVTFTLRQRWPTQTNNNYSSSSNNNSIKRQIYIRIFSPPINSQHRWSRTVVATLTPATSPTPTRPICLVLAARRSTRSVAS